MSNCLARPEAPWALRQLPPFPAIAQRILSLAGREDVDIRELGDVVKMDPAFSADLLRLANSALFNARREVTSLAQALRMVGTDRLKTMATLVAVNRMVRNSARLEALRKVWIHSLATAVLAEESARITRADRDRAYTAGLLHNLGALGLMAAYPAEYSRMLEVSDDYGFDVLETERDLFEIDHCAAGACLALDWGFPEELGSAIAGHHAQPIPKENTLGNLARMAWRMADALGYAAFSPEKQWSWQELLSYLPNSGCSWLTESEEAAKAELGSRLAAAPL